MKRLFDFSHTSRSVCLKWWSDYNWAEILTLNPLQISNKIEPGQKSIPWNNVNVLNAKMMSDYFVFIIAWSNII